MFELQIFLFEELAFQRVFDDDFDFVYFEGFRDVVIGAVLHPLDGCFVGCVGSHEDHEAAWRYFLNFF